MKFGVFNFYTNNAHTAGRFKHPDINNSGYAPHVELTDQGITIFELHRNVQQIEQKLAMVSQIDALLSEKFGVGLSFVLCGASDCVPLREVSAFYAHAKSVNSKIKTIFVDTKIRGEWLNSAEKLGADKLVNEYHRNLTITQQIIKIVNPREFDKSAPKEGWRFYEEKLAKLYADAEKSVTGKSAYLDLNLEM